MAQLDDTPAEERKGSAIKRFLPLAIIGAALAAFFAFDLQYFVSLDALQAYRGELTDFADANPLLAPLGLVALYALLVAISFPLASFLTIFAGFMFGTLIGGTAVLFGATLGAAIIFAVAKTALGDSLRRKAGPWMQKFEAGFQENELSYLFIVRLVPAFPFWLINLAPALLGMKLRNFVIATFFGIIPGTFVYASIGAGAGAVLDAGDELNLSWTLMLQPEILLPLVGLMVLGAIPVVIKRFRKRPLPGEDDGGPVHAA